MKKDDIYRLIIIVSICMLLMFSVTLPAFIITKNGLSGKASVFEDFTWCSSDIHKVEYSDSGIQIQL